MKHLWVNQPPHGGFFVYRDTPIFKKNNNLELLSKVIVVMVSKYLLSRPILGEIRCKKNKE